LQKPIVPAITLASAAYVLSWILSLIPQLQTSELFSSIQLKAAVTPTVGEKALALMTGILPFEFSVPAFMVMVVSAYLILLIGGWVVDQNILPAFKWPNARVGKIATTIMYGAIPFYLLVVGGFMGLLNVSTAIGFAIHTILLAYVTAWLSGNVFKQSM
jgi:hypothetical protein